MLYTAFVVSSITEDNSIGDKIDTNNVQLMEQLLNARLQLAAYGPGVKGIGVVFLGTAPGADGIHEEEVHFDPASGEAYLQLRLPYAVLEQASEAEVRGLMGRRKVGGLRVLAGVGGAGEGGRRILIGSGCWGMWRGFWGVRNFWSDEWGRWVWGLLLIISYQSGRMATRMPRMPRIRTDFFPPAAEKDEPKVSQNPF